MIDPLFLNIVVLFFVAFGVILGIVGIILLSTNVAGFRRNLPLVAAMSGGMLGIFSGVFLTFVAVSHGFNGHSPEEITRINLAISTLIAVPPLSVGGMITAMITLRAPRIGGAVMLATAVGLLALVTLGVLVLWSVRWFQLGIPSAAAANIVVLLIGVLPGFVFLLGSVLVLRASARQS